MNKEFLKYIDSPIAIYGLSPETEKVLNELKNFNIVGLLDSFSESGSIYGKPILTLDRVVEKSVKLIIVAARPGSCRAIKKRIQKFCIDNDIKLFDIRGNDLLEERKARYRFENIKGITKKTLSEKVDNYEIISTDLFDTLIMRSVLSTADIFGIVYEKLKLKGCSIDNFCEKRTESEKYLTRDLVPSLTQIYRHMIDKYNIVGISAEYMAEIEYEVDFDLIIPRKEMCDLLSQKHSLNKDIYIVTDSYYNESQIKAILKKCNIDFYSDVLISCEYGTDKSRQLFDVLKAKTGGKKCLHIGDDIKCDIESAERNGLQSCRVYSSSDLFYELGCMGLECFLNTFSDRIKVGIFISKLFNSPFQFENSDGKITVSDSYDIAYLFFAPIITDFVVWFNNRVKDYGIKNIWFASRDGFLIKKLFEMLNNDIVSEYFLTSRVSVIRAGMETDDDIRYVYDMKFSGTLQKQLSERFGINEDTSNKSTLFDYKQQIFEKSGYSRKNYIKYISSINKNTENIGFFDFVSRGTCQMFVGKMVPNHIKGLYFLQPDKEYMKDKNLDIMSFYSDDEMDSCAIFGEYYILETVLTSPQPSVMDFDENGNAVFGEETRTEDNIQCVLNMQQGIIDYFNTYMKLFAGNDFIISKEVDEVLLTMLHKISVESIDFRNLKVEDPFFNRQTDISDLL